MRCVTLCILSILIFVRSGDCVQESGPANSGPLGLGLMVGSPTGLTGKYWLNSAKALALGAGFPFSNEVKFNFHVDYLWHFPLNVQVPGKLPFYLGIGGRIRAVEKPKESTTDFGIRLPLGFEFIAKRMPFDFFVELTPVIVLAPQGEFSVEGGIGGRFRFSAK